MRYLSLFSGIEAASTAWNGLGWSSVAFAEIEAFPSSVLRHHYPETPNLGCVIRLRNTLRVGASKLERSLRNHRKHLSPSTVVYLETVIGLLRNPPDVLVGGSPCQAYSVAGSRNSLQDPRGQLTLVYQEICDLIGPRYVLWENVPGVLSTKDNAFGCFLAGLAGGEQPLTINGGKWANAGVVNGPKRRVVWRILDAQHFGLAQRRRRVFLLATPKQEVHPAEVMLEAIHGEADLSSWLDGLKQIPVSDNKSSKKAGGIFSQQGDVTLWNLDGKLKALKAAPFAFGESSLTPERVTLSQVVARHAVPSRYYLSSLACAGILRRATNRGKVLPELLKRALEAQIESGAPVLEGVTCAAHDIVGMLSARPAAGGFPGTDEAASGYVQPVEVESEHSPDIAAFGGGRCGGDIDVAACLTAKGVRIDYEVETFLCEKQIEPYTLRGISDYGAGLPCLRAKGGDAAGGSEALLVQGGEAIPYRVHGEHSTAMTGGGTAQVADVADVARCLDTNGGYATNQGGNLVCFHSRQDPCSSEDLAFCLDKSQPVGNAVAMDVSSAVEQSCTAAFAENSRAELRLTNGDGQIVGALSTGGGKPGQGYPCVAQENVSAVSGEIAHTLNTANNGKGCSEDGTGRGVPIIGFSSKDYGNDAMEELAPTMRAMNHAESRANAGGQLAVAEAIAANCGCAMHSQRQSPRYAVRRLTPEECEILMGFPVGYTRIPYGRKTAENCPDGPRYKALGNSKAVPNVKWIGSRIQSVEDSK